MKKALFTSAICFLFAFNAFAQDWNLVAVGKRYNFQSSSVSFISKSIRVDYGEQEGQDSVFWLSPQQAAYYWSYPYIGLVGNILGDSIVKMQGSVYECRFRPFTEFPYFQENFRIETKAEVGSSWNYQGSTTATVTEKKDTLIWGIADSIKTISLSNGQSLRISKKFGLLYLPSYTLVGLQGANLGLQLPIRADFYSDWTSGAVFEIYAGSTENYTTRNDTWTKYYVSGKTIQGDSIKITGRILSRKEHYYNTVLDTIIFSDQQATVSFPNAYTVNIPGVVHGSLGGFENTEYTVKPEGLQLSVATIATPSGNNFSKGNTYLMGVGETSRYFSYGGFGSYFSSSGKLLGYQKPGQAPQGMIHQDTFFGVLTHVDTPVGNDLNNLRLYPNPVRQGFVGFECVDCPQVDQVEVVDVMGRIIKVYDEEPLQRLNVDELGKGFFFLRIHAGSRSCTRPLLLE